MRSAAGTGIASARGGALAWAAALVLGLAVPAAAQTAGQSGGGAAQAPAEEAADPLGRDTPRGAITGLNAAVHRDDFATAARYLQLTAAQRRTAERLARDLTYLIDRYYLAPITAVSSAPEGDPTDGLPRDQERVTLTIGAEQAEIRLVRIRDREAGPIWLISSGTLTRVPSLRRSAGLTLVERFMPATLVNVRLLGASLAQWAAWAATLVVPLVSLWLLSVVVLAVGRRTASVARRSAFESWHAGMRWPVILVLALGLHVAASPRLGLSLSFRLVYLRVVLVAAVLAAAWLLWRFMTLSFAQARLMALRRSQASLRSLLLLAERVTKTVVVLIAIFALLTIAGVNTTTALAGVGIGGVAVALGAQKSVENLLGGVFLLTDRALAVGDTCRIENRLGVVEDITMRSVRLRTLEQTLLSVPAGVLSQSSVENFATRRKILVQSTLRLRYGTTSDQLLHVLSGIRSLLDGHPDVETSTARIRLTDFGVRAIELELFAYVLTGDFERFLAVREDVLLRIAAIVESSGTEFAQPTLVYGEPSAARLPAPPIAAPGEAAAGGL